MDKEIDKDKVEYIKEEILKVLHSQTKAILLLAIFLAFSYSIVDYLVTPENFKKFMVYRIIWGSILIMFYFLNKIKKNKYLSLIIAILSGVLSASMIELMILSFGGHQSPYYAGLMLVIILGVGTLPFSIRVAATIAFIVYAIYLLPIILIDDITNIKIFFNNNLFLIAIIFCGLIWRYINQNLLIKKISLEYDLSKQNIKLEEQTQKLDMYSKQLEQMVEEKTRALRKSQVTLQSLFENANDGIMMINNIGEIMDANQKACVIHGFSKKELIGISIDNFESDENRQLVRERLKRILNGEALIYEVQHYKRDGSKVWLEISEKAIEVEGALLIHSFQRDITEKKTLQEHLFQSQKMESVGQLAGGIAHDFNNMLAGIIGHLDLIRSQSKLDEVTTKRLIIVEDASRKANAMVSKLLNFARRNIPEITPFNLNAVVQDAMKLLGRTIDKRITIKLELNNNIPVVEGDANQIEQAVFNLIINARDAISERGVITINISRVDVKRGMADIPAYIPEGEYALLRVSDTGCGMSEEIISRMFEPFYTTKEKGKGTGLGLSMVYGIIKNHKGHIVVQSKVNEGSAFDIYMPASKKTVIPTAKKKEGSTAMLRGNETILMVDDDEYVMSYVRETLEFNGYKILATTNPLSALDRFKSSSREIALVIVDVIMPLLDGKEMIQQLKLIKPSIKVLAISGDKQLLGDKETLKVDGFLEKPFESYYLLSTIRRLIDMENKSIF